MKTTRKIKILWVGAMSTLIALLLVAAIEMEQLSSELEKRVEQIEMVVNTNTRTLERIANKIDDTDELFSTWAGIPVYENRYPK